MQRSRAMRRVGALAAGLVPAMVATWAAAAQFPRRADRGDRAAASPP